MKHDTDPRTPHTRIRAAALVGVLACVAAIAAAPRTQPSAPLDSIVLESSDGTRTPLSDLRGRTHVLVFGELDHTRTMRACDELATLLKQPPLADWGVQTVLIATRAEPAPGPDSHALPNAILLDPRREAFGTLHVIVMPTIVVLAPDGQVVHAMPGFSPRMTDIITAAVSLAHGAISTDQFEQLVNLPEQDRPSEDELRAVRLADMADEMLQHGMPDAAAERFADALTLKPDLVHARLGLGWILLDNGSHDDAHAQFRAALDAQPDSADGQLGLGFVRLGRGDEDLDSVELIARKITVVHPANPRAPFLLGLIHERRNECTEAMAAFKRSAELFMHRRGG